MSAQDLLMGRKVVIQSASGARIEVVKKPLDKPQSA